MDGEFYDEYGDEGEYAEEAGWQLSPADERIAQVVEGVLEGREHGAAQHDEQLAAYSQRLEQEMPELLDPGIASEVHRVASALAAADGHDAATAAPAFWRAAAMAIGVGRENGPRPTSPEARANAIIDSGHVGRRALPF